MPNTMTGIAVCALVVVLTAGCAAAPGDTTTPEDSTPEATEPTEPTATHQSAAGDGDPTLLAAGDIADCGDGAAQTGAIVGANPGAVAALGDLAYPDGSDHAFQDCYEPAWGHVDDRTRPALGNHDVLTDGGRPARELFGPALGPDARGWYSYELGAWHVVVLDSNCDEAGGCGTDSPQVQWLREDLAEAGTGNVLAYWHHPRFSTGFHGDNADVGTFWDVLAEGGADVVLNGHDHDYQRFAPMAPDGTVASDGIREFVVGTGGAQLRGQESDRDTLEVRQGEHLGVLRIDLGACGYDWRFLPVGGGDPLDTGTQTGTCETAG